MVDDLDAIELLDASARMVLIFSPLILMLRVPRATYSPFSSFKMTSPRSSSFLVTSLSLGHGEEQVFPDDAGCVFLGVVDVELRRMALG